MRILLSEDKSGFATALTIALSAEGYGIDHIGSDADLLEYLEQHHSDLVVISVKEKADNVASLIHRLRRGRINIPILIISDSPSFEIKIDCFRAGADDYVIRPLPILEISVRIQALLRRRPLFSQDDVFRIGDVEINRLAHQVRRNGKVIQLSAKEFALLEYLALNPGRILTRSMIIESVWGHTYEGLTNVVEVYIGQLRKKIGSNRDGELIRTVRGHGYIINSSTASS
jgi:two-component system OmpR family response regulator